MSSLILPGDPLFNISLSTLPPGWQNSTNQPRFICRFGAVGLLEQVSEKEFDDYVYGGEFDARLSELEDDEDVVYFDL